MGIDTDCFSHSFKLFFSFPLLQVQWDINLLFTKQDMYILKIIPPRKTNMTMENPPFEEVFPIENSDFSMSCKFSGM